MNRIVILGARSFVTLPLIKQLRDKQTYITLVSRQPESLKYLELEGCEIRSLDQLLQEELELNELISLLPIWVTANLVPKLRLRGLKKAVILSSSSVVNKKKSHWTSDIALVERLEHAEYRLQDVFAKLGADLITLRPTMVFGYGKDKNISLILRNLKRFHVMPFLGKAKGLRQPIHAYDLARAICLSLEADIGSQTFELGGATQLSYRDMVAEIARAVNVSYLSLTIPKVLLLFALGLIKLMPRYRFLEPGMFERMNEDLLVDTKKAEKLLGFTSSPLTKFLNHQLIYDEQSF